MSEAQPPRPEKESLRALEALYHATFEHAAIGIAIVGLDGSWLRLNPTLCRILGRSAEELGRLTFQDITHPDDLDIDLGLVRQLLEGQSDRYGLEKRYLRPDGTVVWANLTVALVRDDAGEALYFVSIVEDIGERRATEAALHKLRLQLEERVAERTAELQRANDVLVDTMRQRQRSEEALAEREADLRSLLTNAHEAYICIDPAGLVVEWNRQAETTFGWSRAEALDRRIEELIVPLAQRAGHVRGLALAQQATSGQVNQRIELPARRRDGTIFPCEVSIIALETRARGRLYAAFLYDISERKQAERRVADANAALQEVNRQQHLMLDNELVAIVRVRDRHYTWVNRAFELMTGYEASELIGMCTRNLYQDDRFFEQVGLDAARVLQRDESFRTQIQIVRRTGERLWIDISGTMLSRDTGESLWMMLDVTAMRLYQSQVETLAYQDALTGLPNRLLLADRLQQAVAAATRAGQHVAVCFVDLNGFKPINDAHGHEAGDLVLREVANRLSSVVRSHDTVARLGGDEFVVLLTQLASAAESRVVLGRAARAVEQPIFLPHGAGVLRVTAAFGVAVAPDEGSVAADLIARADAAMYEAKRAHYQALEASRADFS